MDVPLWTITRSKSGPNHPFTRLACVWSSEGNRRPDPLTLSLSALQGVLEKGNGSVSRTAGLKKKKRSGFKIFNFVIVTRIKCAFMPAISHPFSPNLLWSSFTSGWRNQTQRAVAASPSASRRDRWNLSAVGFIERIHLVKSPCEAFGRAEANPGWSALVSKPGQSRCVLVRNFCRVSFHLRKVALLQWLC